jgi:predicted O-methyltransferase YrrM
VKGSSQALLREFSAEEPFDFIYVDGCHLANCALADMVLSWDLLKRDGIMIVDDYGLAGPPRRRPKLAVDAFIEIYAPNLEIIEKDYQVVFRKTQVGY